MTGVDPRPVGPSGRFAPRRLLAGLTVGLLLVFAVVAGLAGGDTGRLTGGDRTATRSVAAAVTGAPAPTASRPRTSASARAAVAPYRAHDSSTHDRATGTTTALRTHRTAPPLHPLPAVLLPTRRGPPTAHATVPGPAHDLRVPDSPAGAPRAARAPPASA